MPITKEQVKKVAALARLRLGEDQIEAMSGQLDDILGYVELLNTVDTQGVTPMAHALNKTNAFREDIPGNHLETEMALKNAPDKDGPDFLVPKVIE